MKTLLVISISIFGFCMTKAQNIISVNNNDPGLIYDYTDLQEAVDAAAPGDIIYVYPTPDSYGNIELSKAVTIRGPGYNILQNPSLGIATFSNNSIIDSMHLVPGSEGSVLEGLQIVYLHLDNASNIVVRRNKLTYKTIIDSSNMVLLNANYFSGNSGLPVFPVYFADVVVFNSSDIIIANNIFYAFNPLVWPCYYAHGQGWENLYVDNASNAFVSNNVFRDRVKLSNCTFINNIDLHLTTACAADNEFNNCIVQYNVFGLGQTGVDSTNILAVGEENIHVGWTADNGYSFDARFQLLPGSVARGAASDGGDCGPFTDGTGAYKLSGLPAIPIINEIMVPVISAQNDSLHIEMKATSEN